MNRGGMSGLLKQAQKMQENLQKVQENLGNIKVEGTAGGGMVSVTANGTQEIEEIKIDPQVVDPEDVEMLEDLVLAAVNQAMETAKAKAQEEMAKVTGGMPNLPGLNMPGF
jgi:nucleoid-associated protein EbfC